MDIKIKWGILGAAEIAIDKVIPALQHGRYSEVVAIASRDYSKSKRIAGEMQIDTAYGSYEELLKDTSVNAVYIPLPNHLHVEWSIKSMKAGKHVLCEKPLALTLEDIKKLIKTRDKTGMKIGEAFMVQSHPQWQKARELVQNGSIGELKAIQGFFSYFTRDADCIVNKPDYGGGGIWDIGCYPIHTSRFLFNEEPSRVIAAIEYDPDFKIDRLSSAILDYPSGQAIFTCATQLSPYQKMSLFGTKKNLEIEIPFNSPDNISTRLFLNDRVSRDSERNIIEIAPCNQYTLQGDEFALSIIRGTEVPIPLEDSMKNTAVIRALFKSENSGKWENV